MNENDEQQPDGGELAEAADRVLASLDEQRSERGLTTPKPTKTDRRAVIGLYRRLVDQGAQWPTLVMVDAIGFAMNGDWWPKRIRTGRALARHWNELNDDMILAAGRTDGDARAQTVPPAESPTAHLPAENARMDIAAHQESLPFSTTHLNLFVIQICRTVFT